MALAALAGVSCLGAPVRLADCAVVWNPDTGLTAALPPCSVVPTGSMDWVLMLFSISVCMM